MSHTVTFTKCKSYTNIYSNRKIKQEQNGHCHFPIWLIPNKYKLHTIKRTSLIFGFEGPGHHIQVVKSPVRLNRTVRVKISSESKFWIYSDSTVVWVY